MGAADAVIAIHFAFVVFVAGGGLLVLRWPRAAWLHVPAAVWGAAIELGGWVCPLTYLEHALRGGEGDPPGFVERCLTPLVYPDWVQSDALRIGLGVAVIAVNVAIYGYAFKVHRRPRTVPRPRGPVGRSP